MRSKTALAIFSLIAFAASTVLSGAMAAGATKAAGARVGDAVASSSSGLTATSVRIGAHPAFIRAVVKFIGGTFSANEVEATGPPHRVWASLALSHPGVVTRATTRSGLGIRVSVVQQAGSLRVDVRTPHGGFKYLSYSVATHNRLAIDLWKSTPPSKAAEIRRGPGGCLTLDAASVRIDGLVRAAGRESVFEHRLQVVVRGAGGHVLKKQAVSGAAGRWSVMFFVASPKTEAGTLEAVADSPKDGSLACLVQQRLSVPFTNPAAQRPVYRGHADVDGDGKPDLVRLHRTSRTTGVIDVTLATGRRLSVATNSFAVGRPALLRVGNVNARPGAELFVDTEHISTGDAIGIYTYSQGQLRRAGTLAASAHAGLFAGMTCSAKGSEHFITAHEFVLQPQMGAPRYWTRQDTQYVWHGATLKLYETGKVHRIVGSPSPSLVGVQCGHPIS